MRQGVSFRPATIDDLALIKNWMEQDHVKVGIPDGDWDWEEELPKDPPWREQLIAQVYGKDIGFVQIIDPKEEESHYWGDITANKRAIDIWIGEAAFVGKGFGTIMMQQTIARCFSDPKIEEIIIDPLASNTQAIRFYQKLGFEFLEKRILDGELCDIHVLPRATWKEEQ